MWDLPRPGLEPVSPALAGRFSTTAPPGKPPYMVLFKVNMLIMRVIDRQEVRRKKMAMVWVNYHRIYKKGTK